MSYSSPRRWLTAIVATCACALAPLAATSAVPSASAAAAGTAQPADLVSIASPGFAGAAIKLGDFGQLDGYDLGTDSQGTSYLGWIGDAGSGRTVYLCELPVGATSCAGGVHSTSPLDEVSAAGLHVVVTGPGDVTLVWSTDGAGVANLAYSTFAGGVLAPATLAGTMEDNGVLLDVKAGPGGSIWSLTRGDALSHAVTVHDSLSDPGVTVDTGSYISLDARLAFQGGDVPVLAVVPSNEVGKPVRYSIRHGATWSAFESVPNTWNVGSDFDLVSSSSGAHIVASEADASYRPVVSKLSGSTFAPAHLTGLGQACTGSTHDLVTDPSGRLADVANACSKLLVADLPDDAHAGFKLLTSGGTIAGGTPQITTSRRGTGWVAWGIEESGSNDLFRVAPILLPSGTVSVAKQGSPGSVTVRGPRSCLPPVASPATIGAHAKHGWKLTDKQLKLGGSTVHAGVVDGSSFASGSVHTLTGTATFKQVQPRHHHGTHGKHHKPRTTKVSVSLSFRAC